MRLLATAMALAVAVESTVASADPRYTVAAGVGFVRFGDRRATGGWAPQCSIDVVVARLSPRTTVSYRNSPMTFNVSSAQWLGLVDVNAAILSARFDRYRVSGGPSLDVLSVPLCTDDGHCGRSTGLAPGLILEFGATTSGDGSGIGFALSGMGRHLPAEPQPGFAFAAVGSGTFSW